ncbi:MAG: hypothetical protein IKJ17_01410 [Clostridia bacterium]|nr:hypothetical protein [Clostridia bacterium]
MKRFLAIFMALVMLFSFAACTGSNDGDTLRNEYEFTTGYDETKYNAPGEFPVFKEKQTISVMMPDQLYVEDWETNAQTARMEEELNAELVMTVLPSKEYSTKINLMAAAGGEEFKDAILSSNGGSFSDGMVINLAEAGVIVPVTEYAYNKDIAPNMYEAIERIGWNYYPYMTMPDGEIYYVPQLNDSILANNSKMFVYKPWFEAAGVDTDEIHTTEDFKEALLKVVKNDPNGNGKADEVGISSYASSKKWIHYLMNAFVYAGGSNYMYVKDGELGFAFLSDEWKEGLKYINELYDLGLIDPLAFSQDSAGFKSMVNYDETIIAAWAMTDATRIAEDDPRRVEYLAIPPLNSSWNNGKPLSSHTPAKPMAGILIAANATNPEAVFRFGDYMASEDVSIHSRYGVKGTDWLEPREGDKAMYDSLGYEPYLVEVLQWGEVQNSHWFQTGPYIRQKATTAGAVWNGIPNVIKTGADGQLLYEGSNPEEEIVKLIYTEEEDEIVTEAIANIKTYAEQMTAKFIIGELDIDKEWDAYIKQLDAMNVAGVLECAQAAYDRMK